MAKKKEQKGSGFSAELQEAIDALNSSYGVGTLGLINEAPNVTLETIPTGSLVLDLALGGGWPKSRISELFGDESTAKSTLCWHFLSQIPGPKLYVDSEQSLSKEYGANIGVDLSNLIINQCDTLEQGLSIIRELCDKVDGIVFDSITEAATQKEVEGELSDNDIGIKAKLMSKFLRVIKSKPHDSTLLFVGQVRENPGITYGSNRVTSGGKALRFGAHVRIDLRGRELIKKGSGTTEEVIGHYANAFIIKNKSYIPHVKCKIPIIYDGRGISVETEIIDLAIEYGILEKAGSWIKYDGTSIAQGVEACRLMLIDNPELRQELEDKIRSFNNNSSNNSSSAK